MSFRLLVPAVLVLLLSGSAVATASPAPGWGPCPDPGIPAELQCATLEVPVDHADPDGRRITLDLARAPATGPDRVGSVVFNPGGPGGQGISDLAQSLDHFAGLRDRMDVVTWNPRGSDGIQLPVAECILDGSTLVVPEDRAEYEAAAAAGAAAMAPCRATDPQLFDHLDSGAHARDLDAVRAAIGDEQLRYFGNSYGGVIGATYARLFPERVGAMFLDSTVDHVSDVRASNRDSADATELLFARFVDWCAASPDCAQRGRDVEQVWQDLRAAADRAPIPMAGTDQAVDGTVLADLASGYVLHEQWPELSAAIAAAEAGDAGPMSFTGEPAIPVFPAAALATQCADGFLFDGYDEYAAGRSDAQRRSPNFGGAEEAYVAACAGWPQPVANPTGPLPGAELPPLLGAAPVLEYASVRAATDQVPGSVIIRFPDTGHGLYLNEGNACVIGHADRYLTDGVLPPPGTTCS